MSNYDNTNRGSIWKNDKKEKDTHPDFKGSLNVNGEEFWVSAWKRKEGGNPNSPALSFSIQPKEAAAPSANNAPHTPPSVPQGGMDDFEDIPFN